MDKYQEALASSRVLSDDAAVAEEVRKIVEKLSLIHISEPTRRP